MHTPYEKISGHNADFRVEYRFYNEQEGGRKTLPYQGYRSDFWYEHPEHKPNELFMIHPEFENENGEIILNNTKAVPFKGTAKMWILVPERRSYHIGKIKVGTIGYFKEGNRNVGECKVVEMLGLHTNPQKNSPK